jgi:hypothetical protein
VRRLEAAERPMAAPRPDWSEIHDELAKAQVDVTLAAERIEADLKAHAQFEEQLHRAGARADEVGKLLRAENKDRAPANNLYRRALETLRLVEAQTRERSGDWERLLTQVKGVLDDLDHAERLAREDIQLANRAIAEIAEANRSLRSARTFSGSGVVANLSGAEGALRAAQASLQAKDYEQALDRANAAQGAARDAYNEAMHEARRRQERLEAERRRRAATQHRRHGMPAGGDSISLPDLAGMAAVVIGNVMAEAARSQSSERSRSGSFPSPSKPSAPPSPSSSTSWSPAVSPSRPSSPSSQTNW